MHAAAAAVHQVVSGRKKGSIIYTLEGRIEGRKEGRLEAVAKLIPTEAGARG
jgi:hypothetical protein